MLYPRACLHKSTLGYAAHIATRLGPKALSEYSSSLGIETHRFFVRGKAIMLKHAQHRLTAQRVKVAAQRVVLNLSDVTPQLRVRGEEKQSHSRRTRKRREG